MANSCDQETADEKSARRITAIQNWLTTKARELRRDGFYGELAVTMKFEDGQCMYGEQCVRERTK